MACAQALHRIHVEHMAIGNSWLRKQQSQVVMLSIIA